MFTCDTGGALNRIVHFYAYTDLAERDKARFYSLLMCLGGAFCGRRISSARALHSMRRRRWPGADILSLH